MARTDPRAISGRTVQQGVRAAARSVGRARSNLSASRRLRRVTPRASPRAIPPTPTASTICRLTASHGPGSLSASMPVPASPARPTRFLSPCASMVRPARLPRPGRGAIGGPSEVKLVSFSTAETGNATRVAKGNTTYTDSINYLPPNSFARARVIVGVDASAGVNSQTDPLPVVLRVTGPARSVYQNGRLLTTRIEGCLVNGAARGDLSSEKVYVKLQKMTCPQPGGQIGRANV